MFKKVSSKIAEDQGVVAARKFNPEIWHRRVKQQKENQ
jgi:hypothetical protein